MSERQIYVTESGPQMFFPRWCYSLNDARHEAAQHAQDTIGGWGRARYIGQKAVPLHDHDEWEECVTCPEEAVWAFESYEGTYR